jgi:uncharacterized protein YkwD
MLKKYVSVVFLAATLAVAVAVGVSGVEPQEVDASIYITVQACTAGTIELNSDEKRILDLQNQARTSRGEKVLCVHYPALTEAARAHSQDMLDRDYSSHTSPDGETVKQRLERFGYTFNGYSYYAYGENIAWGSGTTYASADYLFKWWMRSKEHRRNILKDSFREVGIGVKTGTYKTYTNTKMGTVDNTKMGTVDFGVRR